MSAVSVQAVNASKANVESVRLRMISQDFVARSTVHQDAFGGVTARTGSKKRRSSSALAQLPHSDQRLNVGSPS